MRRPETIESLYLDFDGFFASVEQQARPALRGQPVGVIPYNGGAKTCIIAVSREAKQQGVKNIMSVEEARRYCPNIILVPQSPDLYRRAHNALISEIDATLPIETVKSIDELCCRLDGEGKRDPFAIAGRIKDRLLRNIGPYITCSIGIAANRQLAKMACKAGKWRGHQYGNGLTVWRPEDMPAPLLRLDLSDIPGVGSSMKQRLMHAQIFTVEDLYKLEPKHMRKLWNSVTGERLWYALHGYEIVAQPTERGMIGHGRVLPPDARTLAEAHEIARLLTTKAARRLRRAGLYASGLWIWLSLRDKTWKQIASLPSVNDDHAILSGLAAIWRKAELELPARGPIFRLGTTLYDLSPANSRQMDLFSNDDSIRKKWEAATLAVDQLNARYGSTVISLGNWRPPEGGNAGGKISYTRIPEAEDFW